MTKANNHPQHETQECSRLLMSADEAIWQMPAIGNVLRGLTLPSDFENRACCEIKAARQLLATPEVGPETPPARFSRPADRY